MGVPGVCRRGVTDCTGVALSGDYLTLSNNERTLRYRLSMGVVLARTASSQRVAAVRRFNRFFRSEEHTSELQSRGHLVCRLLLEKKKNAIKYKHEDTLFRSPE